MLTSLAIIVDTVCPVCVDTLSRTRVSGMCGYPVPYTCVPRKRWRRRAS
jgi:hypothetical protein